jgi:hypothetical protein
MARSGGERGLGAQNFLAVSNTNTHAARTRTGAHEDLNGVRGSAR